MTCVDRRGGASTHTAVAQSARLSLSRPSRGRDGRGPCVVGPRPVLKRGHSRLRSAVRRASRSLVYTPHGTRYARARRPARARAALALALAPVALAEAGSRSAVGVRSEECDGDER